MVFRKQQPMSGKGVSLMITLILSVLIFALLASLVIVRAVCEPDDGETGPLRAVTTVIRTEEIPFETVDQTSDELLVGQREIKQAGQNGEQKVTYRIVYENGIQVEKTAVETLVTRQAQNAIRLVGTKTQEKTEPKTSAVKASAAKAGAAKTDAAKENPSKASASETEEAKPADTAGKLSYSRVLTVTATAYSPTCDGGAITCLGITPYRGIVAVDPRVIPLGAKLYIASPDGSYVYGYCVAGDTGGAIKGNRVDLFMDSASECNAFGRRTMNVYILK